MMEILVVEFISHAKHDQFHLDMWRWCQVFRCPTVNTQHLNHP